MNYSHWDHFCIFLWLYVNKLILNSFNYLLYTHVRQSSSQDLIIFYFNFFFFNILLSDLIQFVKDNHLIGTVLIFGLHDDRDKAHLNFESSAFLNCSIKMATTLNKKKDKKTRSSFSVGLLTSV